MVFTLLSVGPGDGMDVKVVGDAVPCKGDIAMATQAVADLVVGPTDEVRKDVASHRDNFKFNPLSFAEHECLETVTSVVTRRLLSTLACSSRANLHSP